MSPQMDSQESSFEDIRNEAEVNTEFKLTRLILHTLAFLGNQSFKLLPK